MRARTAVYWSASSPPACSHDPLGLLLRMLTTVVCTCTYSSTLHPLTPQSFQQVLPSEPCGLASSSSSLLSSGVIINSTFSIFFFFFFFFRHNHDATTVSRIQLAGRHSRHKHIMRQLAKQSFSRKTPSHVKVCNHTHTLHTFHSSEPADAQKQKRTARRTNTRFWGLCLVRVCYAM